MLSAGAIFSTNPRIRKDPCPSASILKIRQGLPLQLPEDDHSVLIGVGDCSSLWVRFACLKTILVPRPGVADAKPSRFLRAGLSADFAENEGQFCHFVFPSVGFE